MSDLECPLCNEQLYQMINTQQVFGCQNNHIWKLNQENEIERQLTYIDSKIEFYIELPFNLALKTGLYSLNFENQLVIRRDMYFLQDKNPLEYPSSIKGIILNQEQLFDDDGLCKDEYADYEYKRKMKTTIFISYKFPMWAHISEEAFVQELTLDRFGRLKHYIQTQADRLDNMKKRFRLQVNTFLDYYANLLVPSKPPHTIQHEVGSLSLFDFDKQHSGIMFRFRNVGILLDQRIEDYTSVEGIPEFTYLNDDKIEVFERVIRNRIDYPILFHQEMFNLARQLWRTKKDRMIKTIIINSMTAIESLLNQLEEKDHDFINLKQKRNPKAILSGYFNLFCYYEKKSKPEFIKKNKEIKIKLAKILKKIYINDKKSLKKFIKMIRYMNYARIIRNQIIHNGELRYSKSKDIVRFNLFADLRSSNLVVIKKVRIRKLWKYISLFYNALNIRLMRLLYPEIKYEVPLLVKKTSLAISVNKKTGNFVPMIPNYDWREIDFHKISHSEFKVPPDRFPKSIITTDGKEMMINGNMVNNRRFEVIQQIKNDDGSLNLNLLAFPVDLTSDEFLNLIEKRNFNSIIDANGEYFYKSCEHCGDLLLVTRYARYRKNECTQCNNEFDLFNLLYNVGQLYHEQEKRALALKYARLAYGNLKYAKMDGAFRLGELFMELGWEDFAFFCWDKSSEMM